MKLSTFIAIAAVIGGSSLIPNPAEASHVINLDTGVTTLTNDGIPRSVFIRDGRVIYQHVEHDANPIDSYEIDGGFPKKGGLFGIGGTENKKVFTTYTTPANLITTGNRIMTSKVRNGSKRMAHWSTPEDIVTSPMMFAIRSAKDKTNFINVQLNQKALRTRQGS